MDSLIKIDGKPLEKLIEVVSNGIGTLYRPRAMRKEADASAYGIKVIEKAKAEALAENKIIEADNLDRLNERLIAKEIRRQNNLDDVVEIATTKLQEEDSVTDGPINNDWSVRFFNIVQDVSDDEMKKLWGRILAGEVKKPKSFSLRTLELLRNITKEEADLFVTISSYILEQGGDYFIYKDSNGCLKNHGISYSDIAKLTEIGLIQSGAFTQKEFTTNEPGEQKMGIIYQNLVVIMTLQSGSPSVSIPVYILTHPGKELLSLLQPNINTEYLNDLATFIKNKNAAATVQYGPIDTINTDRSVNYKLPLIDL